MNDTVFRRRADFSSSSEYRLLPFRFLPLDARRDLLTNEVGEYLVLPREELTRLVDRTLDPASSAYKDLKARHFFCDPSSRASLDLLALKYRTRAERMAWFTGLHIFVVTLRCDHSCQYCQVSRQTEDRANFDMTRAHADKAIELTFRSPSPSIKIEFQGGEPLLNFHLIRYVVERAIDKNTKYGKELQFVIASNLSRLSDEILAFCKQYSVFLSTSVDGPEDLHDAQRPVRDRHSHGTTVEAIQRAREVLGHHAVSALMTTTERTLPRVEEVVDEYVRLGFDSIFLRNLSPYGFAVRNSLRRRYALDDWLDFYMRGLTHILKLNREGYPLREEYTSILLQKILSPEGSAYVDLQSPAGLGIGVLVYNYDGAVYASDEGRMLAEMGNQSLRLGHVNSHSYEELMTSEPLLSLLSDTMLEGVPMCAECALAPYCGADPAFHLATQGDPIGHKAFSAFCGKQMAILKNIFRILEDDPVSRDILLGWV